MIKCLQAGLLGATLFTFTDSFHFSDFHFFPPGLQILRIYLQFSSSIMVYYRSECVPLRALFLVFRRLEQFGLDRVGHAFCLHGFSVCSHKFKLGYSLSSASMYYTAYSNKVKVHIFAKGSMDDLEYFYWTAFSGFNIRKLLFSIFEIWFQFSSSMII